MRSLASLAFVVLFLWAAAYSSPYNHIQKKKEATKVAAKMKEPLALAQVPPAH